MKSFVLTLMCMIAITIAATTCVSAQDQTPANVELIAQSLRKLPVSDFVTYINARRIVNEALPGLIPARQYAMMMASLKDMDQHTGINLSEVNYIAMAMRFKTPLATKPTIPEFIFVTRGIFDGEKFLSSLQSASDGELRQEKYGTKNIYITKLDTLTKGASKNPMLASMSDMAAAVLETNTLAFGSVAYVRAAMDAAEGRGIINPDLVSLALRDPNVLISMAGLSIIPPPMLRAASYKESGEKSPAASGDFYMSVTMKEKSFELSMFLQSETAEQAEAISKALRRGSQEFRSSIPNDAIRNMFDTMKVTAQGDQVLLQTSVEQAALAALIEPLFRTPPQKQQAVRSLKSSHRRASRARRRN